LKALEVSIDLPFLIRLETPVSIWYETICHENQIPDLLGKQVGISFQKVATDADDRTGWPSERTKVTIRVEAPEEWSDELTGRFAIRNCLDILNRVITSYQAATGEVSNAGFISPLGTSDMQLFADIKVNGLDVRDRWPSRGINAFPLKTDEVSEFGRYLSGELPFPMARLLFVNAITSLERGQYSLAVLQAAIAVELRLAEFIRAKLRAAGWSNPAIQPFEQMTLGGKLNLAPTDPRSVETYLPGIRTPVLSELLPLRNDVVHRAHLATHEEGERAVSVANGFLRNLYESPPPTAQGDRIHPIS